MRPEEISDNLVHQLWQQDKEKICRSELDPIIESAWKAGFYASLGLCHKAVSERTEECAKIAEKAYEGNCGRERGLPEIHAAIRSLNTPAPKEEGK
jgi:hypothetical protein